MADEPKKSDEPEENEYRVLGGRFWPRPEWMESAFTETYKSTVLLLTDGLKVLAYANGGGCVILLGVMGQLAGKCEQLPAFWYALSAGLLALGLLLCIAGYFAGYLAQMFFLKHLATDVPPWRDVSTRPQTSEDGTPLTEGERQHLQSFKTACAFLAVSTLAFVSGVVLSATQIAGCVPLPVKP